MNNKATIFMSLVVGATIGVLATRRYFKEKYEQFAQEEIDSVKETFLRKTKKAEQARTKPDVAEYAKILHKQGYDRNSVGKNDDKSENASVPYIIPPEEFGEIEGYGKTSFTYYADHILADDNDEIIEEDDIEHIIGLESLHSFGEYEADSVFVRNNRLECDYEILLDQRKYSDVVGGANR